MRAQGGFTLLEMLFVLMIVLSATALLPIMFSVLSKWLIVPNQLHPFEWEVAIGQLTMDVREATEITIQNEELQLTFNQDIISFEKFNDSLRRRVNGQGHEIILQHIHSLEFHYANNGVRVNILDLEGNKYEKIIFRWVD